MGRPLDNVDRGILYHLQRDARNTTTQEIAETVGTSASTVRNRIEALEDDGVIKGYHPEIDYEAANLPLRVLFVCTVPATERADYVQQLLEIQGVVDVREMLIGRRNIYVEVVGTSTKDITRVTDTLHESGVTVESSEILRERHVQPFDHFHFSEATADEQRES
ncbi:transcriptional regulator [Haladaptatus sp. W1]|uniref:Lrp/AsnC family transcriptional regulator n=1 Tax=Haladaptatus sp. W1 TaxID=1897478 RepID=UPI000849C6E0|nr:Lrp/AsnC family transcriptional regulator [Haladaptatus sp. W1]ODR80337.1 transcriptional regulator [Haladaptatus sp. W1]